MPRIPSQVRRFIASVPVIVLLIALSPALAQQKPAPPSPNSQAQLEEHVKELERRLNDAEQKAASAAIEKDYITRVQKQYEAYYEKVLSTQTWTLAIFGLILTAVFGLAAKFSIDIFDSRTKSTLDAALAQVEKKLSDQNAAQLKTLEDAITKRITEQENDLKIRSDYQFQLALGLAAGADERHVDAQNNFRGALRIYKFGRGRQLIPKRSAGLTARNLFYTFERVDQANFKENARKELADEFYNDLEDELALAALRLGWLAPLLTERKAPAPAAAE